MKILKFFVAAFLILLSSTQSLLAQCAMCRATVENNVSYGETSLASGLNFGILYLFVAPYLVVGVIAFFWYKKSRSTHAKKIRWVRPSQS
uniref:Uncharacterized protein n=1 Tax=Roseihalotalea indica TaxID=2867963 RepID=A0AA49GMB0_9BACT|nr:hypothetical protein K4G66_31615 [Tunicatimonas sp. TK19036]